MQTLLFSVLFVSRTNPFGHRHSGPVGVCLQTLELHVFTEHSFSSQPGPSSPPLGQSRFLSQIDVTFMQGEEDDVEFAVGHCHVPGRHTTSFLHACSETDSSDWSPQSS
jgi:hypothetical protein